MGLELTVAGELRGSVRYLASTLDEVRASAQRFYGGHGPHRQPLQGQVG